METLISILGWLTIIMMLIHWTVDMTMKYQLAICIIINEALIFILNATLPEPSLVTTICAPIIITIWIANAWLTKKMM